MGGATTAPPALPYVQFAVSQCSKKGEDRSVALPRVTFPLRGDASPQSGGSPGSGNCSGAEPESDVYGLWGVFDGHNGPLAAEYAAETVPALFHRRLKAELAGGTTVAAAVAAALVSAFVETDQAFTEAHAAGGTTATVCVVYGWLCTLACVGDSRAVYDDGSQARTPARRLGGWSRVARSHPG